LDNINNLNNLSINFNKLIGKSFQPIIGNELLMIKDGMIKTVSLKDAYITSIPCHTPHEYSSLASCSQTFADFDKNNIYTIICKKECILLDIDIFGGDILYSSNSPICRSI